MTPPREESYRSAAMRALADFVPNLTLLGSSVLAAQNNPAAHTVRAVGIALGAAPDILKAAEEIWKEPSADQSDRGVTRSNQATLSALRAATASVAALGTVTWGAALGVGRHDWSAAGAATTALAKAVGGLAEERNGNTAEDWGATLGKSISSSIPFSLITASLLLGDDAHLRAVAISSFMMEAAAQLTRPASAPQFGLALGKLAGLGSWATGVALNRPDLDVSAKRASVAGLALITVTNALEPLDAHQPSASTEPRPRASTGRSFIPDLEAIEIVDAHVQSPRPLPVAPRGNVPGHSDIARAARVLAVEQPVRQGHRDGRSDSDVFSGPAAPMRARFRH
ncbi:hypothetical protein AB0911_36060 [Streptomyces nigra]|uniref:hypothetical protein n=1 Tax=Streptomyces nigra TaxID=1827580 RepID=UPI003451FCDB